LPRARSSATTSAAHWTHTTATTGARPSAKSAPAVTPSTTTRTTARRHGRRSDQKSRLVAAPRAGPVAKQPHVLSSLETAAVRTRGGEPTLPERIRRAQRRAFLEARDVAGAADVR